ncbi:MAG: glutaredoxin family protein [Tissierellales bacterium]|jgi:glutaredoxin-like YruB-family protein
MAKDVTIYTSNTCAYCVAAKEYLQEKGISYTEKNINQDPAARKELMQMGHMGVPVLLIDGEEVVGFNKEKIDQLLGL